MRRLAAKCGESWLADAMFLALCQPALLAALDGCRALWRAWGA